jgi:hypothetical protein
MFVYEWVGTGERSTERIGTKSQCFINHVLFSFMKEMDSSPLLYILVSRVLLIEMGRACCVDMNQRQSLSYPLAKKQEVVRNQSHWQKKNLSLCFSL